MGARIEARSDEGEGKDSPTLDITMLELPPLAKELVCFNVVILTYTPTVDSSVRVNGAT